uniref:Prefoldin subunit 3 n=1 Tax=Rhinopithecus roxellana TaxID=61622 RepID=A0A2K6QRM2_RHIRO
MAAAKDSCGKGEMATGNGRRLHLGIPEAVFVEDVDSFMKQPGNETADTVLKKLDEQHQKYKFMELKLAQKKRSPKGQIPEIKQTLEILKYMQKIKESINSMETRFLLADNLYCKASAPPSGKMCLIMLAVKNVVKFSKHVILNTPLSLQVDITLNVLTARILRKHKHHFIYL